MMYLLLKRKRFIALFLITLFAIEIGQTSITYALTSGPSQPEVQTFQPAGVTDMVDLFSGDFSYNIPIFELPGPNGGYPFNLNYQSGIGMDQEASWVGLGFNLNPGAITRQVRGLPDDFKGDDITTKMSINPSVTVGLGAGAGVEIFGSDNFSLNVGFNVMYNNYTGMGYSIDASAGYQQSVGSSMTGGVGLNLSLNPKEGIGLSPSLNLDSEMGTTGLSAGYHSRQGFQNISASQSLKDIRLFKGFIGIKNNWGASLSFAHPSYTPQVSMPMRSVNIAAQFEPGGSWWGIFGAPYIRGFYNEQWLKNNKKKVKSSGYGYLYYQNASSTEDVLDFNREKDGMVSKESPNLAIPSLTYDIYAVNGQGLSSMYRPIRNDYGRVFDPETSSVSVGGSVGVDVAPAASHGGVNLDVNHAKSTSGLWQTRNDMLSKSAFQQKSINSTYEPWYFKGHGEPTANDIDAFNTIGGEDAVKLKLTGSRLTPTLDDVYQKDGGWSQTAPSNVSENRDRKPRSQVVQTITNEQLINSSDEEMMSTFKISYLNESGTLTSFDRSVLPGHHIAGFTALNTSGLQYNYALPAYNLYQEEVSFSVSQKSDQTTRVNVGNNGGSDPDYEHKGTKDYLKETMLPKYAHAYLLTSITGPDYVDVTGDGVSADDLGYWVKFTYQRTSGSSAPYKWREPFSQAQFQEGWMTDPRDDKGQFTYGEKEVWYLAKAETKSHIAEFELFKRDDGRGVAQKLQDSNGKGAYLYGLNCITLYTRSAGSAYPIKTVKFDYDYSLCQGVYNNASGEGKLTLKKLWFEYGDSERGQLNPYEFTYQSLNPDYDFYAYDRWGNYKPYPAGNERHNRDFPYVDQDPDNKETLDEEVAVWSLKEIIQPSGSKITVDYETDDYAYVQNKVAMQMTPIVDPYSDSDGSLNNEFLLKKDNMKIRFPLEAAISSDVSATEQRQEVLKYLDSKTQQLAFKALINLRSPDEDFYEYITGYADIDFTADMGLEKDASGDYVYGYFYVEEEDDYHPFSLRAFQHLRVNQPELTNSGRTLEQTDSNSKRIKQIRSLAGFGAQVRQIFEGFNTYCYKKKWGRQIMADRSWIRLKTPDKIKYGGGLRVKQLTLSDEWSEDEEGVYGNIYQYTTEEDGEEISSGVASYEPLIGGEENPMRYAKKYVESVPLRANNNLFFEYPVNESYFPGPQVGYSKVTVMSLASAARSGEEVAHITLSDGLSLFPDKENVTYGTTGKAVHEFYTAKDFPVITDETSKSNKPYNLSVMVPFLGNISISKLASSQGYSIITNDMHGKPKQISQYAQSESGAFEPEAQSWVRYNYQMDKRMYDLEKVSVLNNVLKDNEDGTLSLASSSDINNDAIPKVTLGQETELFMDMRHFEDNAWTGGVRVNVDIVYIPLLFVVIPVPVPSVWPRVSKSASDLKTAVTNKVIFKSGILESTEAYDNGSLVKTSNLKWDKVTGQVVLTSVNNNYDDPIYNYNVLAYHQYRGMGAAYQNAGFAFAINNVVVNPYKSDMYSFSTVSDNVDYLQAGDELLLYYAGDDMATPVASAVYVGEEEGNLMLYSNTSLTVSEYNGLVVRPGFRNLLSVSASSLQALEDPSEAGTSKTYTKTISIPKSY